MYTMRSDFDAGSTKRAFAREGLAYAVQSLLYGFGYLRPRHHPTRRKDLRTVVFLHGLGGNRASMFPLQGYLRFFGHNLQYSFNSRAGRSIEQMAIALKRQLDENIKGGSIDLVCHSLGGIVARYYVQALGGHRRVRTLVTLASPHRGTYSSVYVPTPLVSQLRPGSAFLDHLDALAVPKDVQITSVAVGRDLIVVPGEHALAPFGRHVSFDDLGHVDMLLSLRVFQTVHEALEASRTTSRVAPTR